MNKKKWGIIAGILLVAIIGAGIVIHHSTNKADSANTIITKAVTKKKHFYSNLSKAKATQVKRMDKAVRAAVEAKADSAKDLEQKIADAQKALAGVQSKDTEINAIKAAYGAVLNVLRSPAIDSLQTARTAINNLKASQVSEHMQEIFEKRLIQITADATKKSVKDVRKASHPLTASEAKAKADAEAKAKADAEAKAKAEAAAKAKAAADAQAKANAAQAKQAQSTQTQSQGAGRSTGATQSSSRSTYTTSARQQSTQNQTQQAATQSSHPTINDHHVTTQDAANTQGDSFETQPFGPQE